jgi:hypothetical protein
MFTQFAHVCAEGNLEKVPEYSGKKMGDIPAFEQTMTELHGTNFTTNLETLLADVY